MVPGLLCVMGGEEGDHALANSATPVVDPPRPQKHGGLRTTLGGVTNPAKIA